MTKTKLRFVVPHSLFGEGLINILAATGRFEIDEHPDVLLIDVSMMKKEIVGPILVANPYVKVIVIGREDAPTLAAMVEMVEIAGAWAYVRSNMSTTTLANIIDLVLGGHAIWPAEVLEGLRREAPPFCSEVIKLPAMPCASHKLSPREHELLNYLGQGLSNKHIANATNTAEATVKVHVKAILRKLRVSNRTQAAVWVTNNGNTLEGNNAEGAANVG